MMTVWLSEGRTEDSGSTTGTVSAFGAVAPTAMPISRPAPDSVMATFGWDSLLQASVRMSALMSRPTGPVDPYWSTGPPVPVSSAELTDACVTWAIPPSADLGI